MTCLLDTCIISDLYEQQDDFNKFTEFLKKNDIKLVISISSILELRKLETRFSWFKGLLIDLPFYLIKPADILMKDEVECYPEDNSFQPYLINLSEKPEFIDYMDKSERFAKTKSFLEQTKPIILESLLSRVKNFRPDNDGKYSNKSIEGFLQRITKDQLNRFYFDQSQHIDQERELNTRIFKSLRSQLLITLWKFYIMKHRKARNSDIFDITIASALPYVDMVLTEKNMVSDVDQIKRRELFFDNLEAYSLNNWIKAHTKR